MKLNQQQIRVLLDEAEIQHTTVNGRLLMVVPKITATDGMYNEYYEIPHNLAEIAAFVEKVTSTSFLG